MTSSVCKMQFKNDFSSQIETNFNAQNQFLDILFKYGNSNRLFFLKPEIVIYISVCN